METPVVGVLGGGQLGRMLAEAGHRLGIKVVVLDPLGEASPAGQVTHGAIQGSFNDAEKIQELARQVGVLTVEIEHVNCDALDAVVAAGTPVQPSPHSIRLIQDKFAQKQHFAAHNLPLGAYREVASAEDVAAAGQSFGYPLMLKSKRMAYDGKGNAVVANEEGIGAAMEALKSTDLYVEQWVPFVKELAVMVVRGATGEVTAYPVVETRQQDSICHTVLAPAASTQDVQQRATNIACKTVAALEGAGVFGVELFELEDGRVLLNEVAPRPHNSGHYTIEACEVDQFEAHLRAIVGLPVEGTRLAVGASLMLNILGTGQAADAQALMQTAMSTPGARLHWYGKAGDRPGRKLGHITLVADDISDLRERLVQLSPNTAQEVLYGAGSRVGIIMGSDSDLPTMQAAARVLDDLNIAYDLTIVSAHRTPDRMVRYAETAVDRGLKVIIAGAGGAAHLPGMVAAMTPLPVIGVPIKTSTLSGVDSLHSIVQMPRGVPVATVAIGNAMNAGLLAARILGATNPAIQQRLEQFREDSKAEVLDKAARLEEVGYEQYLATTATREVK
ncbi:uncharacterized protein MONBRDRAFT_9068 [Monosiga brevicollis MX1]|uniref:phosphoribosylaminoimidazole carboxylase n=1 Tax=Monosiga brevicollis TaxID=81824 RepID=A9V1Z8_MONBE|nr:uncharacterized protein MONBRDRAFT_9068 [Monosiga brevicollis MX1]EDQ88528.1 predicted protein [Monosiga brevicollis MX1]|eukprot:XP_001746632.1 hypothetical protein [Monosiga brevicollis MX1]